MICDVDSLPKVCTTPAVKVAVDPLVEQPPTNFYLCNHIDKRICIQYVSSHVINYQHVFIDFAIIVGVALQEHEEYNNLPH
jgi:hypothetical protein